MKIAMVTDWFHPRVGGIEVHVQALALRLRERGHEVTVITPWPGPTAVSGIRVVRMPLRLVPGLGVSLSPLGLARGLAEALRADDYDLVHAHMSFGSTASVAAGYAGPRASLPVLATFHSVLGRLGWVFILAQPFLGWRRWPFQVTAVSEAVADDLRWIMPERDVCLLPNAIDPAEWTLPRGVSHPGRLRLVTTARLQRRKRVDALVRILAQVRSEVGSGVDVSLEIIGSGPDRRALEALIRRLSLEGSIKLLGEGDTRAVRDLLARGDVFVNACHQESFGIAALEALSCGLPVVARREGGVGSFIDDGRNGVLVGSDADMASALVELATNPAQLERLRDGTSAGIPAEYTWDVLVDRHLEIYRQLLETQPAPR